MLRRSSLLALMALTIACSSGEERSAEPTAPRPLTEQPREVVPPEVLPEPREVRIPTADGVTITGTLQPAARPDAPLVILVHQLGGTRAEWAALVERLHARPAVATLAIDLRGHGASTEGPDGQPLAWRELDNAQWAQTAEDVAAAVRFVADEASGITPARIAVIGSSIGSSAAISAAARTTDIDAVAALSPGRAYRGFDAITPATQLGGRPFLAVTAREEIDSVETAQAMARITASEPVIVEGGTHGVAMLTESPELLARVEAFLRQALGAERASE